MKKFLVIFLALLLCGGGGAGAYMYFFQPAEASAGNNADEAEDGHGKKAEKHAKGGHGESAFEYVQLDPLILPIVDQNGVSQVVSIVIALQVADSPAAEHVERMSPKLKDAYIQDMYGVLNQYAALKGGVIQVGMLKSRLNHITAQVMGEDAVQDVLLQVVQQRPI